MARKFEFFGSYNSFVFEAETIAYMNAIGIANDNTVYYPSTPQQITGNGLWLAVNSFIAGLKSDGVFSKFNLIYLAIWDSATMNKFNLLNPIDTDGAFRLTYFGGWTHNRSMQPNGVNGYANTHHIPSANITFNSEHIALFSNSNNTPLTSDSIDYGSFVNVGRASLLLLRGSASKNLFGSRMNSEYISTTNTDAQGLFVATKNGSNTLRLYKNGSLMSSGISNGILPSLTDFLGTMNRDPGIPYSGGYTNQKYILVTRGSGLTAADVLNLNNRIQSLKTTLAI